MKLATLIKHSFLALYVGLASCQPSNLMFEKTEIPLTKSADPAVNNTPELWIGPLSTDWITKEVDETTSDSVVLNSEGGANDVTLKIAESLLVQRRSATIIAFCYSGCTGLLPFFESVEFVHEPSVGFHWNAVIMASALTPELYGQLDNPDDPFLSNTQRTLEAKVGFDSDAWNQVQKRIEVQITSLSKQNSLFEEGGLEWDVKHSMWYPTSDQMRDLLGLKFKGRVCSDNPICVEQRVEQWSRKSSVIVGNTIYRNGVPVGEWSEP